MRQNRTGRIVLLISSIGILCCTGCASKMVSASTAKNSASAANNNASTGTMDAAGSLPGIRVISPLPNGQWPLPAGDFANTRFSPLNQINTTNVQNLHQISTLANGIPHGNEGQPLVVGDTMYVVTPFPNYLYALDLSKPGTPIKWKYNPHASNRAVGVACCDVVNRGASYSDGKIVYNILDGHTVAVDAKTGQEVWRTTVADPNLGETETMAPLIVKNMVYIGISGSELGVRGRLTALDLSSGKILWRAFSTGPDADVRIDSSFKPYYKKDQGQNLGLTTWGPGQWKLGGGTIWGWLAYDPELNLIYYGTGNSAPWNEDMRPGDNKWAVTIFARDATTGYAKWAWQAVPHAGWDYDQIASSVLVDMNWNGRMRKLLINAGKTGYVVVLDRETGELLSAVPFEPVTWSRGYNLKTGLPNIVEEKTTHVGKMVQGICPSNTGALNQDPSALSPRTGLLYIPAHNICMNYEGLPVNYIAGTPYIGANVLNYAGPGGYDGELVAWDVAHAKKAWSIKYTDLPLWSGVLVTGGDVVFYGTLDGWFKAVDARNGKPLWQVKLGSGVVGNPITYLGPDGKQYVAIYSGTGGAFGAAAFSSIDTKDPYAALGAINAVKDLKKKTNPGGALYIFGY